MRFYMGVIKINSFILFMLISFSCYSDYKYTVYPMSELELTMLPPFCQVWAKYDEKGTDAWIAKLKIPNIHHICKGLNHVNHTVIEQNQESVFHNAKTGASEFTYVLNYETQHGDHSDFPLKAFVLTNRAKMYVITREYEKANADFTAALKVNPKYDKIYYEMANYYLKINDKDKAKEIIKEGLRNIPDSKLLNKIND